MREIKFRIWEKPGVLLQGKDEGTKVFEGRMWTDNDPKFWANCLMNTKDEYELMQFTGKYDKNGNECFEGDKIRQRDTIYTVSWNDQHADFFPFASMSEEEWEIVGNIYQTPPTLPLLPRHSTIG